MNYIKTAWLLKEPNIIDLELLQNSKYLLFDGTYFHKNGCLIILITNPTQKVLDYKYIVKENYLDTYNMLTHLKSLGLNPLAVTLDGHKYVIQAFKDVWPDIIIQRCLYHILRQGLQWLRTYPKTEAGKELKSIIIMLATVKKECDKNKAILAYKNWYKKYELFIKELPSNSAAAIDLKKATGLINNALSNMYHFLKDQNIASTTNLLESYFSQLKHKYRCHRGLTEQHKIAYLKWFCYFKNIRN